MTATATATERNPARVSVPVPINGGGSEQTPLPGRIKTTLGEYGDRMPIGILDGEGRLHKDIVTKPWKTRDERELGKKIPSDAQLVEHIPLVVAHMCSRIGPHKMDELDDKQKTVILSTMYMADVFYIYTLLRTKTMGSKLSLNVACPRAGCGVTFPYSGDLLSTEVNAVDDIDAIMWRYDLEDPITIRRQSVTHFQMAYPKWNVMEHARGIDNDAEMKVLAIQGTIVGINDEQSPVIVTLAELDEVSKRDLEGMQEGINNNFLGPKMALEGECTPAVCSRYKRGGFAFNLPIDWRYKSFFAASSR